MNRKIKLGYVFLSLVVAAVISCSSDKKDGDQVPADVAEATQDAGAAPADPNAPPADGTAAAPEDANAGMPADPNAPPPAGGDMAAAPADPNAPPAAPGGPETTEGEMAAANGAADAAGAPGAPGAPPPPPGDAGAPPPDAGAPGGDMAAAAPPADAGAPADSSAAAPPPADSGSTTTASNDTGAGAGGGDLFGAGGGDTGTEAPAPRKHSVAVAHIKDAPFSKGGQNLNTVYVAREGDTLESISQKLFGEDRTKMLKKANPALKKGVKTGDKVYFNSPNRPDDKEKMLTVYEDQGLEATHYTTKDGDTLKSLAQEWYGSEGSWKEIYAINRSLASTKELPAGTDLMYWPATAAVAVYGAKKEGTDVAQNNPPPPADAGNNAPPPGNNAPPPPPGGDQAAAGQTGNAPQPPPPNNLPPPPPPPDMNAANNPPPPPIAAPPKHKHEPANALAGMDKDTIMYAVAAGVFLVGGGLLVAIRRRNARRNSGITQV